MIESIQRFVGEIRVDFELIEKNSFVTMHANKMIIDSYSIRLVKKDDSEHRHKEYKLQLYDYCEEK